MSEVLVNIESIAEELRASRESVQNNAETTLPIPSLVSYDSTHYGAEGREKVDSPPDSSQTQAIRYGWSGNYTKKLRGAVSSLVDGGSAPR